MALWWWIRLVQLMFHLTKLNFQPDIVEGVNDETNNHVTIHTYPGCKQDNPSALGEFKSTS